MASAMYPQTLIFFNAFFFLFPGIYPIGINSTKLKAKTIVCQHPPDVQDLLSDVPGLVAL